MTAPSINFNAGFDAGSSSSNQTTTVVTQPPNSDGDVIHIAMVSDAATQTFTFPAGFSKLYDAQVLSALSATLARKTAASESGNYSVTLGISERQSWISFSVSGDGGVHASATANTGTSGTATFPAITTTVNDCLLIRMLATDTSAIAGTPTNDMAGAGWTELASQIASSSGEVSIYYKVLASAGTETTGSVTLESSDQWWATTFAIAPAVTSLNGAASITLGALTISSAGKVAVSGAASNTLGALTVSATGTVAIKGSATITLDALVLVSAGTGQTIINGAASITLDALTLSATGTTNTSTLGSANITLGALTSSAAGTVAMTGAASNTLGTLTLSAAGQIKISGAADVTLDTLTSTGSGHAIGPAPVIIDYLYGLDTSNTTGTILPTPINVAGDVIYIAISSDASNQVFTPPVGFAALYDNVSVSGNTATFACFYKASTGSEPVSYTVTLGTSERQAWVIWSVRNDGGVDGQGINATGNSATATIPALTTGHDNCLVFGIIATDGDTQPHGATADYSGQVQTGAGSASTLGWQYLIKATAGSVSSNTATLNISEQWLGVSFAIKPVGAPNTGSSNITLDALMLIAVGGSTIHGSASITLGTLTVKSTTFVPDSRYAQLINRQNFAETATSPAVIGSTQIISGSYPSVGTTFWISIESANGDKLAGGPLITGTKWTYRPRISQAGEWSLEVPLGEPRLQFATLKRRVHCYIRRSGRLVWLGGGIIESRKFGLSDQNVPVMTLSGPDLLRELAGVTVAFEVTYSSPSPPDSPSLQILTKIFEAVPTWSYVVPSGLPNLSARFVHESALNALVGTCEKLGAFFWMESYTVAPRRIVTALTPVASSIVATNIADPNAAERNPNLCLISDIERTETSWDATNRLIVYGAGDGQARLTLTASTAWPDGSSVTSPYTLTDPYGRNHVFVLDKATNTITDTLSVDEYGQSEQAVSFKEIAPITPNNADMIAAANTLVVAAVSQLVLGSFPTETYTLSVAALRAIVHPGMQIRVVARKVRDGYAYININETLIIQGVDYEIDETGEKVTGLQVATTWKPEKTGATILSEQIQKITAMEAHPQIGANENTISYREDVDDDYGATFPFWMSRGTQAINSITLRYKLEKLRSSVKTVGGTASGSAALPQHTHPVAIPAHDHDIPLLGDAASQGFARQVYFNPPDAGLYYDAAGGPAAAVTSEAAGAATVTSQNSASNIGISINIANAITATYGVFEDPGLPYGVNDLDWTVNGTLISETPASLGDGWYEVDITHYLISTQTLRPILYSNNVSADVKTTSKSGKKVRVTTQIELRTTIQTLVAV